MGVVVGVPIWCWDFCSHKRTHNMLNFKKIHVKKLQMADDCVHPFASAWVVDQKVGSPGAKSLKIWVCNNSWTNPDNSNLFKISFMICGNTLTLRRVGTCHITENRIDLEPIELFLFCLKIHDPRRLLHPEFHTYPVERAICNWNWHV